MKFIYKPKNKLEKFGEKVYSVLVENFSQTFFVGGLVRDVILKNKIIDIDIATSATSDEVVNLLEKHGILYSNAYKNFGNIIAKQGSLEVEITTLRKDLKSSGRFPKVVFIQSAKEDSKRRDFTINALYLAQNKGILQDFQNGIQDILNKKIRFIGNPNERIKEDPLRIIRALRFALTLKFKLEAKTKQAIKLNLNLIKFLTKTKLEKEIFKLKSLADKKILTAVINDPKLLDKHFK